ncbi:MAG: 50S ribosomal protein L31e [Halobacteriota archaeon]
MATIVTERVYSLRLRQKMKKYPRWLRTKKAARYVRNYLSKHLKADPENIRINESLNESIWSRGVQKPPAKIKVRAVKFDDGVVEAELA